MPQIVVETWIRAPIETVFDAARDAELHTKTTAFTREKIVGGRREGAFQLHDEVTFEATHLGVRQRLSAKIVAMEAPHMFTDEMLRGAFKTLRHVHRFQSVEISPGENGTQMTDILTWIAPLGVLGKVADALFLVRYMTRFLQRRNAALKAILEETSTRL